MASDFKFGNPGSYVPSSFQTGTTNAGFGFQGMGAAPSNSVAAAPSVGPSTSSIPPPMRYPLDLASTYRHYLQILILKQGKSGYNQGKLTRTGYDWGSDKDASAMGGTGKNFNVGGQTAVKTAAAGKYLVNDKAVTAAGVYEANKDAPAYNTSRKATQAAAYIHLYMPDTMQIDMKQDYDPLSVTDALGLSGIMGTRNEAGGARAQGELAAKSGVMGDSKDVVDLTLVSKGYALNPQLEVLYKGPNNRQFRYQFRFTPRNSDEAAEVENIITTLRFHACPEYIPASSSMFFIPPSEFRISHMIDSDYNYSLPRIGQCVLEEVNVNYAAAGHFATFKDGRPIEIQMDLTFKEVNVLTKADILAGF